MTTAPNFVTFTGVDDATDLGRVRELSARYPIEWALLFSPERAGGEPRFPSLFAVGRIVRGLAGLRLAAHLCGGYARSVVAKGRCTDLTHHVDMKFVRFQVNTADPTVDADGVGDFAAMFGGQAVLQCRRRFPRSRSVDWLFDASGGRGVTPDAWPEPPAQDEGPFVGYAGGLGPSTMAAALGAIAPRHDASRPYWIDMESGIRDGDDRLDLDACEAVCRATFG